MLNEARRHKQGHLPGDLPKRTKIRLRESRLDAADCDDTRFSVRHARAYRRAIKAKSITSQRQRDAYFIRMACQ